TPVRRAACRGRGPGSRGRPLQRPLHFGVFAQHRVRHFVLLARLGAEAHPHRDELAAAGLARAHGLAQHGQVRGLEQRRDDLLQAGAGRAHRGDLELAGELEAVFRVVGFDFHMDWSRRQRRSYRESHHIRNSCHRRLKKPASSTASSATSGRSATTLPSSDTFTVPIRWPLAMGATRVCGTSMVGLSCSYLPRGVLTRSGSATPSLTSSAWPFHSFCVATACPASYSLCVS